MLLVPRYELALDEDANRIALAAAPDCRLLDDIATSCTRLPTLRLAGKTGQFDASCKFGARIDAAFTLIAQELPGWSVRRLVRDDGLWLCALSRTPELPIEFDEMIETSHEDMALAILSAAVEAKRRGVAPAPVARTAPRVASAAMYRMNCDNFV